MKQSVNEAIAAQTKVLAAPNPYNSNIGFPIVPSVSGRGTLELYNTLGQRNG